MYSEHAKPDTNALIIISPHKGLLSQLAAQQCRIFSPLVFYKAAALFSLCFSHSSEASDVYAATDKRGLLHSVLTEGDDGQNVKKLGTEGLKQLSN